MGNTDKLAEYAKLAEGEGKKVENGGVVMFGQDEVNRRMRNRTSGGVGGRGPRGPLLPDETQVRIIRF